MHSDLSNSSASAISLKQSSDIWKVMYKRSRCFDSFSRCLNAVHDRLKFVEDKLKLFEDKLSSLDAVVRDNTLHTKRPYTEKYKDVYVDESLLMRELALKRWRAFQEMPADNVQRTFHEAFGAGFFGPWRRGQCLHQSTLVLQILKYECGIKGYKSSHKADW